MDRAEQKLDDLRDVCAVINGKLDNMFTAKQFAYWAIAMLLGVVGSFVVHLLIKG